MENPVTASEPDAPDPSPTSGGTDDTYALAFRIAHEAQRKACRRRQQRLRRRERQAAVGGQQETEASTYRSPSQRRGDIHEARALATLEKAGLILLARNLRCAAGEIDLAMRDGTTLVLVEVRARSHEGYGGAVASVDRAKRSRIRRAAALLLPGLARRHWAGALPPVRFDVVAYGPKGEVWLRGAFAED